MCLYNKNKRTSVFISTLANIYKSFKQMKFKAHYKREGIHGWMLDSWDDANHLLGYQKAEGPSFTIFTLEDGCYIQCAGGKKRLTVEARIVIEDKDFKHYRFGKGGLVNNNEIIECNCGPIKVDLTQILTIKDARILIREFIENNKNLSEKYIATDITETQK